MEWLPACSATVVLEGDLGGGHPVSARRTSCFSC